MSGSARDIINDLFTYRELSAINTVLSRKELNGLTLTEFHSIVSDAINKKLKNRIPAYKTKRVEKTSPNPDGVEICTECNAGALRKLPLNTTKANMVEGGYTHMTLCAVCMDEKYYIGNKLIQ